MTAAEVTPVSAPALAFVDDLDQPELNRDDHHHLSRVLRLAPGTVIALADGAGRWRAAHLAERPQPCGPVHHDPAPTPALTVAFAPVKGERPEWVVQKLTELGVDRIVPFLAERSVVRWDAERGARQVARWRKVAREAAMQCRRTRLPEVAALADTAAVAALPGASRADRDGEPPSLARPALLVGPEGGWSPAERALLAGATRLGEHVLRAETAAVAAGAVLAALRAGLVGPHAG